MDYIVLCMHGLVCHYWLPLYAHKATEYMMCLYLLIGLMRIYIISVEYDETKQLQKQDINFFETFSLLIDASQQY